MKAFSLRIRNLSFGFKGKQVFEDLSLALEGDGTLPTVILGPSGCGKTTLLKLAAGLLVPEAGEIEAGACCPPQRLPSPRVKVSMVFQEPRFLPWYTLEENIALPLETDFGKRESRERARRYLELVSLEGLALSYPEKLSGGQKQRASIARAFAYPSELLLMDEPFQSLDIPLRIELMDVCLSLLARENRLTLAVTHDPREAVYMAGRIVVLGTPPQGIVFDREIGLSQEERSYGSFAARELEKEIIEKLKTKPPAPLSRG